MICIDDDQESVRDMYLDRVGDDAVHESLQEQKQIRIDRRFTEIKQISELSSLVRVLSVVVANTYEFHQRVIFQKDISMKRPYNGIKSYN